MYGNTCVCLPARPVRCQWLYAVPMCLPFLNPRFREILVAVCCFPCVFLYWLPNSEKLFMRNEWRWNLLLRMFLTVTIQSIKLNGDATDALKVGCEMEKCNPAQGALASCWEFSYHCKKKKKCCQHSCFLQSKK